MTLSRQLVLIISLMFLLVFAGTFLISVDNTRHYLNEQLKSHAQDTATSLGLSLSPHMAEDDVPVMESMVDAIFDRGDYREIVVENVNGRALIDRNQAVKVDGVPHWFVQGVPLLTPQAEALIMSGWRQGGRVFVQSHPGYAYEELWANVVETFWWSVGSLVLAIALTIVALRYVLRPLKAVEGQALAITDRQFPQVEDIPSTRELRRVVVAMNRMSAKVKEMLNEQTELAERMREEAYVDPVTGAGNRRSFEQHLARMVGAPDEYSIALLLLRVDGLESLNRAHGYTTGDELLRAVGQLLRTRFAGEDSFVGRIGSSEFGVLLTGVDRESVGQLADQVLREFGALRHADVDGVDAHIGISGFSGGRTASELLAEADVALRNAQGRGPRQWHMFDPDSAPQGLEIQGTEQWREILQAAITQRQVVLMYQAVETPDLNTVKHYEVLARVYGGDDSTLIPASLFVPMAERVGLAPALDRLVIEMALANAAEGQDEHPFAINLSRASLSDRRFLEWLNETLYRHRRMAPRMAFELAEHTAYGHLSRLRALIPKLKAFGVSFGIDHFGVGAPSFAYLHSLPIDYVKIDGSYIVGLDRDKDNQFFVQVLTDVARGLDIEVIAEFVETAAQLDVLRKLRVSGVQGYFVVKPELRD